MYEYVPGAEVKPYRKYCDGKMNELKGILKNQYGIACQYKLIGSGAKNFVTRNGNSPFDLDYNIEVGSIPGKYSNEPGKLKDLIRQQMDILMHGNFSCGQDSTASIKYIVHSDDRKKVVFSFDVGVIRTDKGVCSRLIHSKETNLWIWNELPDYSKLPSKVNKIKKAGKKNQLRAAYLKLKNMYLAKHDKNHPSYIIYAEAVEQTLQLLKPKEEKNGGKQNGSSKAGTKQCKA